MGWKVNRREGGKYNATVVPKMFPSCGSGGAHTSDVSLELVLGPDWASAGWSGLVGQSS